MERASEIDDMRTLRANLATSLQSLRDAAAQQRSSAVATVARLQSQIALAQSRIPEDLKASVTSHPDIDVIPEASDEPVESLPASYVAAFKLQRAEHVANRFGEAAKTQMLSLIAAQLKTLLGPNDRLLRWKGTSFVMFINSTGNQDIGPAWLRLSPPPGSSISKWAGNRRCFRSAWIGLSFRRRAAVRSKRYLRGGRVSGERQADLGATSGAAVIDDGSCKKEAGK